MPDLTEAELAELEQRYINRSDVDAGTICSLIAELRRLRAENAEMRKRAADAAASIQAAMNIADEMEKIVKSR